MNNVQDKVGRKLFMVDNAPEGGLPKLWAVVMISFLVVVGPIPILLGQEMA